MLADAFPKSRRGRVFAIFYAAVPLGAALGYVLGGLIEQHYGWRSAFFIAGLPGLALALLVWTLKDPPRGANDPNLEDGGSTIRSGDGVLGTLKTYGHLFSNRAFTLPVLGYAAYTFAIGALAFWMPDFLEKSRGLSVKEATVEFGASFAVAGLLGTLLGGWLADRLLKRTEQAYLWVCGVSMLIAVPFLFLALAAESPRVYLAAMVLGEIFVFIPTGPVNSAVINAVAPQDRAKAMAACILVIHLLGDVPSPPLVGFISDLASLEKALLMVPLAAFVCSVIWLGSAVIGGRDRGSPAAEPQRNPDKKGL
jgi:MFS family permease